MLRIFVGNPFSVSLILGAEKVWIREGGGKYQVFLSKIFCLTVPRNFVGRPFSVSLLLGAEKVWIGDRGEYQVFLLKIFCLTVPKKKNFVSEHFCAVFQKSFGCEKMEERRGSIKIFRRKLLMSQC